MSNFNIQAHSIIHLQAWENYTLIHFKDQSQSCFSKTLKRFEEMLADNPQFVRINRADVININYIKKIRENMVELTNGLTLEISRRRQKDVLTKIAAYHSAMLNRAIFSNTPFIDINQVKF